ncbi:MAG: 2-oxoglutarate and iron-dependent oxygenase domain-containing protein [Candidatus Velthaea sp.]|jgi:isopenicillin N synthase-like dioxygenase
MTTLPTIDLRELSPGAHDRDAALERLRATVGGIGAFYLTGHGVDAEDADRILGLARRFFALPQAERRAIEMVNSPHFRGYTALGNEYTQGQPDWREEVDIGAERPVRREPGGSPYWGLQGPNQWPSALPELRPAILAWLERLRAVAADLGRALAEALELPRTFFDGAFNPDPHLLVKLVHYPGREAGDRQGVGSHKDSGFLTLVLQDDAGGSGLQFHDGQAWVEVIPKRGAFVINLGEALELATNHRLRATLHRVESPSAGRDYYSVPFFYNPRFDYVVEPLDLPDHVLPPLAGDARVDPADPIFAEYGYNALKGRLRSHRDVAARFYDGVNDIAQFQPR